MCAQPSAMSLPESMVFPQGACSISSTGASGQLLRSCCWQLACAEWDAHRKDTICWALFAGCSSRFCWVKLRLPPSSASWMAYELPSRPLPVLLPTVSRDLTPLHAQVRSTVLAILTGLALLMPPQQLLHQTPPRFARSALQNHLMQIPQAAIFKGFTTLPARCRDCNPCGAPSSRRRPTPLDTGDVQQPAPPRNAHGDASDLHLANVAGFAAASEARARGRGRADAGVGVAVAGAGMLHGLSCASPASPAAPCPEPEGQEDNNLPRRASA